MSSSSVPIIVRPSVKDDAPRVLEMIEPFVAAQQLLPRTLEELEKLTENGFSAESEGRIVGFSGVEIYSRKLAEIQCLAVAPECHGRGIGRMLVEHCVALARRHGVYELMAITSSDRLFQLCGFDYSLPNERRALFVHPCEQPEEE